MPVVNPGIRRLLASAIQRLFNGASFSAPLTHSAIPTRAASGTTGTFTRATTKTVENNDGYLVTLLAGEIGFPGARRVRNLVNTTSEDNTVNEWVSNANSSSTATVVTLTTPDASFYYNITTVSVEPGHTVVFSVKLTAGTKAGITIRATGAVDGTGGALENVTATATPTRFSVVASNGHTVAQQFLIGFENRAVVGAADTSAGTFTAEEWQLEDVTAQTTQTAGEYVSVGVESAPYYHGSFVDGVKCFPTDLAGNALPTSYTYDAVSLNGVAGTYVSTPDSVAASITGDIDIRVKAALTNWSSGAIQALVAKRSGTDSEYVFRIAATGELTVFWYSSGVIQGVYSSTAATGIAAGVTKWVRVTRDIGVEVVFYLSDDGETWTRLGDVVAAVGSLAATNTAIALDIGSQAGSNLAAGKIYQAQIYNGINGTLAVDFDASRYAGGTTLTGSTGETWTLNGNAIIHPTNSPMLGYQAEGARTNLILSSDDLTNGVYWSASGSGVAAPTVTVGQIDQAGTTKALKLDFPSVSVATDFSLFFTTSPVAVTASPHSNSWRLKGAVGGEQIYISGTPDGVTYLSQLVTLTDEWVDYELVGTPTAANWYWQIGVDLRDGGQSAKSAQTVYVCFPQLELGSFASSYIATTTVAVTRNADVEAVSTSGNIAAAAGSVYLEYTPTHSPSGTIAFWGTYVDASNYTAIIHDATNLIFRKRIAGVNYDATIANAFVSGTTYKACATWGASGTSITLNGTEGTPHANTTAAQIAATMQWGADGNSLQQPFASVRNCRDWLRQLSASERAAVTA